MCERGFVFPILRQNTLSISLKQSLKPALRIALAGFLLPERYQAISTKLTLLLLYLLLQGNLLAKYHNMWSVTVKVRSSLTYQLVNQAAARGKPYKMADGGGLFPLIRPDGAKYWRLGYRFAGKQNTLSFGICPDVTLNDARTLRDDARNLLADGLDPRVEHRAKKETLRAEKLAAKETQIINEARLIAPTRFILDNEGALTFRFGNRHIALTSGETTELRVFLDATRAVTPKVMPCP